MFEGLFQPVHLLVIFGIALLIFGPKKLPGLGKGIGEGIRGFKAAMNGEQKTGESAIAVSDRAQENWRDFEQDYPSQAPRLHRGYEP
jgi:sec-independent protein translocase protein TatA